MHNSIDYFFLYLASCIYFGKAFLVNHICELPLCFQVICGGGTQQNNIEDFFHFWMSNRVFAEFFLTSGGRYTHPERRYHEFFLVVRYIRFMLRLINITRMHTGTYACTHTL